jgi:metal-responsive CopG/Arc/MetJ family transcriptional regulator
MQEAGMSPVKLPGDVAKSLDAISSRLGLDPSDVVTRLVKEWIEKRKKLLDYEQTTILEWFKDDLRRKKT